MAGNNACESRSIPMTKSYISAPRMRAAETRRTIVDHFQLADEVQPNLAKFVLKKLQEQRQQMLNGRFLAQQGCKTGDLYGESRSDMLTRVGGEISDAGEDLVEDSIAVN